MQLSEKPVVTVGIPVFNGDKFLHKRLDSILSQSFKNFQIIISDNASQDKTQEICEEYARKDSRILYTRQESNMGALKNFQFVLDNAESEFFVWAAVDDIWDENFLSKNIAILQSRDEVVGSVSNVKPYGNNDKKVQNQSLLKKKLIPKGPSEMHSISGAFEQRIRFYLKNSSCSVIYAVFRTDELKKGFITKLFLGNDWAINLSMLKFGDIHVVNEDLLFKFSQGVSTNDIFSLSRSFNKSFFGQIMPWSQFTVWCARNLGMKVFLKNLDYFFVLNYKGFMAQMAALKSKSK